MKSITNSTHGLEFKFITLTIFLLIVLGTIKAQKQNTVSLNSVMVSDSIDRTKYLWNLLNYNYEQSLKDTTLYYSIDFTTSIPDSNWSENFKGVIVTEIRNGKQTQYLSEGVYTEANSIKYFGRLNLIMDFLEHQKPKKYKKFRKNKITSFERKEGINSFQLSQNYRKFKNALTYKFKRKNLTHQKMSIQSSKTILGFHIKKINWDFQFDNINNQQLFTKGKVSLEYSKKDVYVIIEIKYTQLPFYKVNHKIKIDSETPKSLQSLIMKANNPIK